MSILKTFGGAVGAFFSGGTGEILDGAGMLIKNVGDASVSIREAMTGEPSPEKQAEGIRRLDEMLAACNDMQGRINLAEVQSSSLFVAGWRPALGWTCAISVGVYFIPRVIITMFFWSMACWKSGNILLLPEMGIQDILGLTFSMLGMAALRTYEKTQGVHKLH